MSDDADIRDALVEFSVGLGKLIQHSDLAYSDFEEIMRYGYVKAAEQSISDEKSGSKASVSRIAAKTGLSRREVSKLLAQDRLELSESSRLRLTMPAKLLAVWKSHKDYVDDAGKPLEIPFDSIEGPSFVKLVRLISGDSTAAAVKEELIGCQSIEQTAAKRLRLISTHKRQREKNQWLTSALTAFLPAQINNLNANILASQSGNKALFCRHILSDTISANAKAAAKLALDRKLRQCNDDIVGLVECFEDPDAYNNLSEAGQQQIDETIGVVMFYFESTTRN